MIEITEQQLNSEIITNLVRRDSNGAVVTFLGNTRDNFEGKDVIRLEYEAYVKMAVMKLDEIRQGMMQVFGIEDIAIAHWIVVVDIGETSLVVAVASPHRTEAFQACHKVVDRVKEIVPIWKKEVYTDGSRWVACEDHEFVSDQPQLA